MEIMSGIYSRTYFGFVYIWRDRKHNKYYVGSHMGTVDDGYVCSSQPMKKAYTRRPHDFKRRILEMHDSMDAKLLREKETRWLRMIKPEECGKKFYNLSRTAMKADGDCVRKHWTDPIARAKHVESISKSWTPERKKEHGERLKKKWAEPAFRSRMDRSESNRLAWSRDDGTRRAKQAETNRKMLTPELIARRSKAVREHYAAHPEKLVERAAIMRAAKEAARDRELEARIMEAFDAFEFTPSRSKNGKMKSKYFEFAKSRAADFEFNVGRMYGWVRKLDQARN